MVTIKLQHIIIYYQLWYVVIVESPMTNVFIQEIFAKSNAKALSTAVPSIKSTLAPYRGYKTSEGRLFCTDRSGAKFLSSLRSGKRNRTHHHLAPLLATAWHNVSRQPPPAPLGRLVSVALWLASLAMSAQYQAPLLPSAPKGGSPCFNREHQKFQCLLNCGAMMQAISHSIRSNKGDDQRKLGLGGTLEEFHALPQQLLVGISDAVFRLAEFHLA